MLRRRTVAAAGSAPRDPARRRSPPLAASRARARLRPACRDSTPTAGPAAGRASARAAEPLARRPSCAILACRAQRHRRQSVSERARPSAPTLRGASDEGRRVVQPGQHLLQQFGQGLHLPRRSSPASRSASTRSASRIACAYSLVAGVGQPDHVRGPGCPGRRPARSGRAPPAGPAGGSSTTARRWPPRPAQPGVSGASSGLRASRSSTVHSPEVMPRAASCRSYQRVSRRDSRCTAMITRWTDSSAPAATDAATTCRTSWIALRCAGVAIRPRSAQSNREIGASHSMVSQTGAGSSSRPLVGGHVGVRPAAVVDADHRRPPRRSTRWRRPRTEPRAGPAAGRRTRRSRTHPAPAGSSGCPARRARPASARPPRRGPPGTAPAPGPGRARRRRPGSDSASAGSASAADSPPVYPGSSRASSAGRGHQQARR